MRQLFRRVHFSLTDRTFTAGVSVWQVDNGWAKTAIAHDTGVPADITDFGTLMTCPKI